MKTLSVYEKRQEPVLLRKDFIKEHSGLGYKGSQLRDPSALFKTSMTPSNGGDGLGSIAARFKRPLSSVAEKSQSKERKKNISYLQQLRGNHEYDSVNTLRNSVLPQTIPKAVRFKYEQKGSHFAQYKDPLLVNQTLTSSISSSINMLKAGSTIMTGGDKQSSTIQHGSTTLGGGSITEKSKSPSQNKTKTAVEAPFHIRRDTLTIKVDEFIAQGRPLWMRDVQKCIPGPDVYYCKSEFDTSLERVENKPNKCLFGLPHDRFKLTCNIEKAVKVYDHTKHYASSTMGQFRSNPDMFSPQDTNMTRKRNFPKFTMPHAKNKMLFDHELQKARNTPGPGEYDQEDRAIRNMRNTKVTIPHEPRPEGKSRSNSPGPGAYETEALTCLATKVEQKIKAHSINYSEETNIGNQSQSTKVLVRPTSKTSMMKYFEKSRSATSPSWLLRESDKEEGHILGEQKKNLKSKQQKDKIVEHSDDEMSSDSEKGSQRVDDKSSNSSAIVEKDLNKGQQEIKIEEQKSTKQTAPWICNQEFISFVKDLDYQSQKFSMESLQYNKTLAMHRKFVAGGEALNTKKNIPRNSQKGANHSLGGASTAGSSSYFKHRGGNASSLKTLAKTTLVSAFAHNQFI